MVKGQKSPLFPLLQMGKQGDWEIMLRPTEVGRYRLVKCRDRACPCPTKIYLQERCRARLSSKTGGFFRTRG